LIDYLIKSIDFLIRLIDSLISLIDSLIRLVMFNNNGARIIFMYIMMMKYFSFSNN